MGRRRSVQCLVMCRYANVQIQLTPQRCYLQRYGVSPLAYCHISTLPCSHHFALSLSASWSSYCFCRRTSSFIKRAVIFSVPGWP